MPSLLPNANDTILATYQASIVTSVALPFLVYFALGALLFFLFCILRTRIPSLSEPKRKLLIDPPPALSPSFVNWLFELMRIPNHAVAKTAGTEALIVLRFMRSSFFFFLILSLLSITVILPINYSGGEVDRLASQPILSYNETSNTTIQVFVNQTNSSWSIFGVDELTALRRISIENVGKDSWQSIAHLVLAVVIQLLALVNVRAFMAESIGTRVQKVRRDLATCTGKDCGCLAAAGSNSITPCAQSPTGNGNASSATLDAPNSPGKPAHIDPDSPSAVSLNNTSLPRPPSPKPHTPVAPIDLRSILLLNLPRPLRHPFALRQYFERTLKFGAEVESVVLVAANAELEEALEKRWEALRDVEEGWIAWVGNSGESRGGSVESVRKRVDGMRKELENEGIALTRVVAAGPGMENGEGTAIELPGLPLPSSNLLELGSTTSLVELGPNPLTRPRRTAGLWTRIKSKLWPGSVPPHALQESDALSEAWARFRYFHRRVGVLRKQAGKDAQVAFAGGDVGNDDGGSTAFVTFKTARSAVIACQTLLPPSPGQGRGSFLILPAPPPRDLYWPNLSSRFSTPKVAFLRTLFALGCLVALVFFWAVPVGMIATFLSVENLTARFPGFAKMAAELSPQFLDAFRAFVPSILVGIWMAILPAIVLLLCYIQGIETYSWIELSAFSKLFFYYVWNLVLVFPISGGVWNAIEVVGKAGEIPYLMGGALPGVAPFFINCGCC